MRERIVHTLRICGGLGLLVLLCTQQKALDWAAPSPVESNVTVPTADDDDPTLAEGDPSNPNESGQPKPRRRTPLTLASTLPDAIAPRADHRLLADNVERNELSQVVAQAGLTSGIDSASAPGGPHAVVLAWTAAIYDGTSLALQIARCGEPHQIRHPALLTSITLLGPPAHAAQL